MMSKHQTVTQETPKEVSDEERKNNRFSFMVGIAIAIAIIIIYVVLSLLFPAMFH
jgi:predicted nucleic acid-binding Zn ribbon protein